MTLLTTLLVPLTLSSSVGLKSVFNCSWRCSKKCMHANVSHPLHGTGSHAAASTTGCDAE